MVTRTVSGGRGEGVINCINFKTKEMLANFFNEMRVNV